MGCQASKDASIPGANGNLVDDAKPEPQPQTNGHANKTVTTLSAPAENGKTPSGDAAKDKNSLETPNNNQVLTPKIKTSNASKLKKLLSKDKSTNVEENGSADSTDKSQNSSAKKAPTGNKSAKVRPLTTAEEVITTQKDQNLPKSVAYDIDLTGDTVTSPQIIVAGSDKQPAAEVVPDEKTQKKQQQSQESLSNAFKLKFPRRLPKLSSLNNLKDLTSESIEQKQKKAELKRREHLEEKKQKARMFVGGKTDTSSDNQSKATIDSDSNETPDSPTVVEPTVPSPDDVSPIPQPDTTNTSTTITELNSLDSSHSLPTVVEQKPWKDHVSSPQIEAN